VDSFFSRKVGGKMSVKGKFMNVGRKESEKRKTSYTGRFEFYEDEFYEDAMNLNFKGLWLCVFAVPISLGFYFESWVLGIGIFFAFLMIAHVIFFLVTVLDGIKDNIRFFLSENEAKGRGHDLT